MEPKKRGEATFLGPNGSGQPQWEIDGQTYTDSVSTIGGHAPAIGKTYPALCNQPDSRSQWVALIPKAQYRLTPREIAIILENWTHWRRSPGRASRSIPWAEVAISQARILTGMWESETPNPRVRDGKIYLPMLDSTILVRDMGDNGAAFYDEGESEYLGDHYALASPTGSLSDFIIDEAGNLVALSTLAALVEENIVYTARVQCASEDLSFLWAENSPSGYLPVRSLLSVGDNYYYLAIKDFSLWLIAQAKADGAFSEILLSQTLENIPAVFLDDNPDLITTYMVSGGTHDPSPLNRDPFGSWWDPDGEYGVYGNPLNPWGFTNERVFSTAFATYVGERRFLKGNNSAVSLTPTDIMWGGSSPTSLPLRYSRIEGVLEGDGIVIPHPPAEYYFPSLCAYSLSTGGSPLWEIRGWVSSENEDEPSLDTNINRIYMYSPRMIHDGKLFAVVLRLTYRTIEEAFATVNFSDTTRFFDSDTPKDGGGFVQWMVEEREFGFGDPVLKRSRRLVGLETYGMVYDLATGGRLSASILSPKVRTKFPTRGNHIGAIPPKHGIQGPIKEPGYDPGLHPSWETYLGYDIEEYWPEASEYFDFLNSAPSIFYSSGLYSAGFRVGPVWPVNTGKPGTSSQNDRVEGIPWYDPESNQGYNRITSSPGYSTPGEFSLLGDKNNNGTPDTIISPAPPSAWLYETVWHEMEYDWPHVSDFFNPLLSSSGGLIIFPPRNRLGVAPIVGGPIFDLEPGAGDIYSWSGGNFANFFMHTLTPNAEHLQTTQRQVWEARAWDGTLTWRHYIEASEFESTAFHEWARPCCANGKLYIHHRFNRGPIRLRIVDDTTGELISDEELDMDPGLPSGDWGGIPHETILSGEVAMYSSTARYEFSFETFTEELKESPYLHGLYPEETP